MEAKMMAEHCVAEVHPLEELLVRFVEDFWSQKESRDSIDNLTLHRQYGLVLSIPQHWPLLSTVATLVEMSHSVDRCNVVIIYSSSEQYRELSTLLESRDEPITPTYFSWQELYVAMDLAGKDARLIKRFRHILEVADLTVFCGAPLAIPEVIDQVRGFCEGCLVVLR